MKRTLTSLAVFYALTLVAVVAATLPKTTFVCETSDTSPSNVFNWYMTRGEARNFQVDYQLARVAVDLSDASSTNGVSIWMQAKSSASPNTNSIYQIAGGTITSATGGTVVVLWPSTNVPPAAVYNAQITVPASPNVNGAARGTITVKNGPISGVSTSTPVFAIGVTRAIAGSGITLSPASGLGDVTISATGSASPVDSRPATNDIEMATNDLTQVNCVKFIPNGGDTNAYSLCVSATEDTPEYQTAIPGVVEQLGQELQTPSKKLAGATLENGMLAEITGGSGDKPVVTNAAYAGAEVKNILGMSTHDWTSNDGRVTSFGLVRDLDTTVMGAAVGDRLYWAEAGPTNVQAGTAPFMGWITRYHASDGVVLLNPDQPNSLSDANATDLTDAGDSALHYHTTDRARANHTGTQTASTISDFDTEVSNNGTVASALQANGTVARTADQNYGGNSPTNVGTFTAGILTGTYATSDTITAAQIRGAVIYVTGAATITLPAVSEGDSVTIITIGDVAVSVDPNGSDKIWLDGTALDDGDKITNLSTAGNTCVITYYSADGWYAATDSWTDGG